MKAAQLSRLAMRTHTLTTTLFTGAALTLVGVGCNAIQPKPQCKAQTGDYAARYTMDGDPVGDCDGKVMTGEVLTLQYYSPKREGNDKPKLAIIPTDLAEHLAVADEAGVAVTTDPDFKQPMGAPSTGAVGPFSSVFPDDKNICLIKDMGSYKANVALIPKDPMDPMAEDTPPVDQEDAWTNLRMVVTPTSNAVYFGADLERRDGTCTVKYKVTAVSPVTNCAETKDTTEIDPMTMEPLKDPDTGETVQVPTGKTDESKCEPSDDNGLNVDIAYECDANTFLCVPANDYPKMK
jgi:hypothetical protein